MRTGFARRLVAPFADPRHVLFAATAIGLILMAAGSVVVTLVTGRSERLTGYYLFHQDLYLVACALATLVAILFLARQDKRQPRLRPRAVAAIVLLTGLLIYGGADLALLHFPQSSDEKLAAFAADYLADGLLARPIPPGLEPVASSLMGGHAIGLIERGYWVSPYFPVYSAMRAVAILLGDAWLTGPILVAVASAALWWSARRLWPDRAEAPVIAVILLVTSAQVLLNAMSAFAMTGHLAMNAIWLACFLRGGRAGHAIALALLLVMTGLHQAHHSPMVVSGFVVWLFAEKRWRLALAYIAAAAAGYLLWKLGYPAFLASQFGPPVVRAASVETLASPLGALLERLGRLQPHSAWLRFIAWQNVLLVPLALVGLVLDWRRERRLTIFGAMGLSSAVWILLPLNQVFGFGYRYLTGVMPLFVLLAVRGWILWSDRFDSRFGARALAVSSAGALILTVPTAMIVSRTLVAPFATAHRITSSANADIVFVQTTGIPFLGDIARVEAPIRPPLVLVLGFVDPAVIVRLCASGRPIAIFDASAAGRLGARFIEPDPPYPLEVANRALLDRLGCGVEIR